MRAICNSKDMFYLPTEAAMSVAKLEADGIKMRVTFSSCAYDVTLSSALSYSKTDTHVLTSYMHVPLADTLRWD